MIKEIFDRFTVKERHFIVEEKNMIEVMKMVQSAKSNGYYTGAMEVGNCGWAKEPNAWFIHTNLTKLQWGALLQDCKNKKYQIVIKEPDNMYFTKIEGSK